EPDLEQIVEPAIVGDVARRQVAVVVDDRLPRRMPLVQLARRSGLKQKILVKKFRHRWIRADPPFANDRTCASVAIVVSPGKVVVNAPCAQPSFTDSSADSPMRSP